MALAIRRMDHITSRQIRSIQAQEHKIRLAERLRWNGELLVSGVRGYLIAGDLSMLDRIDEAQDDFKHTFAALEARWRSVEGAATLQNVRFGATVFENVVDDVVSRERPSAVPPFASLYDTKLLPARRLLRTSLDQLIDLNEELVANAYRNAEDDRVMVASWLYGFVVVGALFCAGLAWYLARLLGAAFRREEAALEVTRDALTSRDELTAVVAHDLRNPLGAITMKAALLQHQADSEPVRNQAASIENTAARMEYLIQTMVDVATIDAKRLSIKPEPCIAGPMIRTTYDMFAQLAGAKQLRFEQHVETSELIVLGDRERILQVLSNLVGNAIKFTPSHGTIKLSVEPSGNFARFSVADTGPGIDPEHVPYVFDRYWKHDRGTKGSGLGLFIAKSIVDAHSGKIWVETEPGHGATFSFTVPLAEASKAVGG
jgi:signal transduction histidine kinase